MTVSNNSERRDGDRFDNGSVETAVREIVQEILTAEEPVTATSDFFELGGNSILGARLVARLRQVFGVRVTIRDVFRARTVGGIASAVEERRGRRPSVAGR